jgi:hypothetical protein
MGFVSNLAANSPGNSGIYGQPSSNTDDQTENVMSIVNNLKDREMRDFQNKANFMADLSIKQDRLRRLYDPATQQNMTNGGGPIPGSGGQGNMNGSPNVVMGQSPTDMTGYQKGELGLKQQALTQDKANDAAVLSQRQKLGQGALDIKQQGADLAQQKSDQINDLKQADLQRKIADADSKLQFAQQKLDSTNTNVEAHLAAQKELAAAVEARHKLEMDSKQHQFDTVNKQHQEQITSLEQKVKDARNKKTTTNLSPDGSERTTTTQTGDAAKTVQVKGKDGQMYEIPADQLDDWNANHAGE